MSTYLTQLTDDYHFFPDVDSALTDPDGLLAIGGDLSTKRIINAYRHGIFPWFSKHDPILWWSPSERATLPSGQIHISRSMKRFINKTDLHITINHQFPEVIQACAKPRQQEADTWITQDMIDAYIAVHHAGVAHSVEVWKEKKLVGGLYGVCVGQVFCGESMFSQVNNSSKLAFIALHQHFASFGGKIIDCQMQTSHLQSLGVKATDRGSFINQLLALKNNPISSNCWEKQSININSIK